MKKLVIAILIATSVLGVGCGSSNNSTAKDNDKATVSKNANESEKSQDQKIEEIVKNMKWEIKKDDIGDKTIVGVFDNTTDKKIDYLELDYKLYKDGVVEDSSFTNETDIAPGEKRKIEILPTKNDFDKYEITVKQD